MKKARLPEQRCWESNYSGRVRWANPWRWWSWHSGRAAAAAVASAAALRGHGAADRDADGAASSRRNRRYLARTRPAAADPSLKSSFFSVAKPSVTTKGARERLKMRRAGYLRLASAGFYRCTRIIIRLVSSTILCARDGRLFRRCLCSIYTYCVSSASVRHFMSMIFRPCGFAPLSFNLG